MEQVETHKNQTILDIAMQVYGDVSVCFAIAQLNGVSITDPIPSGTLLQLPESDKNIAIVNEYKKNEIYPASFFLESDVLVEIVPSEDSAFSSGFSTGFN